MADLERAFKARLESYISNLASTHSWSESILSWARTGGTNGLTEEWTHARQTLLEHRPGGAESESHLILSDG